MNQRGIFGYAECVNNEPATSSLDPLVQYRLLHETGRGAMSLVWEAVDARNGRRVAIKTLVAPGALTTGDRAAWAARMEREARAVARLSHPNIVTTYEVGRKDGQPYLVMEFLPGQTLRQRLRTGPVAPVEAARILGQMAAALDAVHAAGVLHRDIKPTNFMLTPGGAVKLIDFGLARQEDDALVTQADMMVGSPSYMAPEQINGDLLGPAGDTWALGVILHEMLSGQVPFGGDRISAVLEQITTADPPLLPGLSPAAQAVLRRALEKDPAQRYPSAGALAEAFQEAVGDGGDAAAAPPLVTRQRITPLRRVWEALLGLLGR